MKRKKRKMPKKKYNIISKPLEWIIIIFIYRDLLVYIIFNKFFFNFFFF